MPVIFKNKVTAPLQVAVEQTFSPMLAGEGVLGQINYRGGLIVMPKLNGVRGLNQGGVLMPRSLKKLSNNHTRNLFSQKSLTNLDGELVVGDFSDEEVFVISTSGVGTVAGEPDVAWWVFDFYHPTATYLERLAMRDNAVHDAAHPNVVLVPWKIVHNDAELQAYADWALEQGYEGLVIRCPKAKYKQGRSSPGEATFMRFCPWLKGEARILAIHEGEINNNESVRNELGFLKKSSHKANKVGSGQAGAMTVEDLKTGIRFNMPVPSDKLQKYMWANKGLFMDELAHYNFKPAVKIGGKPRFPQFQGMRAPWDMS